MGRRSGRGRTISGHPPEHRAMIAARQYWECLKDSGYTKKDHGKYKLVKKPLRYPSEVTSEMHTLQLHGYNLLRNAMLLLYNENTKFTEEQATKMIRDTPHESNPRDLASLVRDKD